MFCLKENGSKLWCNAHLKYKLWFAKACLVWPPKELYITVCIQPFMLKHWWQIIISRAHPNTEVTAILIHFCSVPCSRTLTCSLGSRIRWPPSHWSANFITWATAAYNWCCDDEIKYIIITSESANAKKICQYKMLQEMWAAKCAANHEFGPISIFKMEGSFYS